LPVVNQERPVRVYIMSITQKDRALSPDERDRYVIERLRNADEPVSGEALAGELGMSRVALWKRVESLKAWGYGIEASRKGYELVRDDGLAGWELDAPGPVALFDTVDSTMDEARAMAIAGAPSGATALALGQRAGRGNNGSSWESPAGGLYLSVVVRSALPPSHAGALALEAAAATMGALGRAGVPSVSFRWPGDVMDGGRKVGGILVEAYGGIGAADFYIVCVGLNVSPYAIAGTGAGTGAGTATARRAEIAAGIVKALVAWAAAPALDPARWSRLVGPGYRSMTMELWNGERRVVELAGFNERGDVVPTGGGPCVSIGEYRRSL